VIYGIPSPTFLTRKVLTVSKKKHTRERESEGDGCTNMRPQPPRGQSRINYHRKKKREKGQKPGN